MKQPSHDPPVSSSSSPRWALSAIALVAVLCSVHSARAQGPTGSVAAPGAATGEMNLARVLQVAVRQKPSLEQAAIDIEVAEASMLEVLGLDDWIFDATGRWSSTRLQAFNLDQDVVTLEGNLTRRLSTGGTMTLHADTNYTRAVSRNPNPVCIDLTTGELIPGCEPAEIANTRNIYNHTVSVSLAQPLLRDRGKAVTYAQRNKARIARDAAVLAQQVEAVSAVRQVVGAYWELAYAWRDLEIRKNSMVLTRERLKNTQAGIDAGAVAPTEALAVEQSIVARAEEILGAEQVVSQRSLDLRRLAGLEIGARAIDLRVSAPLSIPERSFDLEALLTRAKQASPTLARLRTFEKDAQLEVQLSENGLLPELDLLISFGPQGSADDPATALKNMVTFDDLQMTASLTYRRSLAQRGARGSQARARAQLRKQVVTIRDAEAQIASQLVMTVKRAEAAKKRFEPGARAIELASKNIEAEKARFELGRSTNFDVLQRQDELERAQLRQARALIDFLDAIAQIDALTGDILGTYGITLDGPS